MSRRSRRAYIEPSTGEIRSKYNYISLELRATLIDMVLQQGISVYKASKILQINNSTAKVIVRNFRKKGHIYCRKEEINMAGSTSKSEFEASQQALNQDFTIQLPNNSNGSQLQQLPDNMLASPFHNFFPLYYPVYLSAPPFGILPPTFPSPYDLTW